MRIKQVKNLFAMRDSYHPILSRLFRKYKSSAVSFIMNGLVGCSCFILLAVAFLGLSDFYATIEPNQVLFFGSSLIFSYSFFVTIKSAYAFMYSGRDTNLLKTLPVTKSEILVCNFAYFYKNQILFSLYIISSSVYSLIKNDFSLEILLEGIILAFLVLAVTIFLVMILSAIIHYFLHLVNISRKNKKIKFQMTSSIFSLVKCEKRNLSLFSSLKIEILTQWVMSLAFAVIAFKTNIKYLSLIALYPAISMISISSFSREGEFYKILQTLPINNKRRILAKVYFYMIVALPVFVVCYGVAFAKTKNVMIPLLLIPNLIYLFNTSLIGVKADMKNPKIHWTNPQEAFRMNFLVFFGCVFLGTITELFAFFPEFVFIKNQFIGITGATVLNLLLLLVLIPKKEKYIS